MRKRWFLVGMMFLLLPWLMAGCGIAQEVHNAVVTERDFLAADLQSFQGELDAAKSEVQSVQSELDTVQAELEQAQAEVESAQAKNSEMTSNLEKAEAELEAVQARLLEAKAEHEAFKLNLNETWYSLVPELIVLMSITDYWNNTAWLAIGGISEEEYAQIVGIFMADTGTYINASGDQELIQYWQDFFSYAAQEKEAEMLESLANLTDLLIYELIPERIEGIAAAVSGDLNSKKEAAAETELSNIQTAVVALMVDNELSTLPNPVSVATNDMSTFPDTSVCGVDKILGPTTASWSDRPSERNPYIRGEDKDGYVLYQHDLVADGKSTDLVKYVATRYTKGTYTVDKYGTVTQVTTGYE